MASASTRQAVSYIRSNFPPGTTLKQRATGKLYVIGARHGMSDFWLMDIAASTRGLARSYQIYQQFDKVER